MAKKPVVGPDAGDHLELKQILGESVYRKVIHSLSEFVKESAENPAIFRLSALDRRKMATQHARLAAALAARSRALLRQLHGADLLSNSALTLRYLVPTDFGLPMTLSEIGTGKRGKPRWALAKDLMEPIAQIAVEAREWHDAAARDKKRKPRPAIDDRLHLAECVGVVLLDYGGIHLTRGADGIWARVLTVCYAAAGFVVPHQISRDLSISYKRLEQRWPNEFEDDNLATARSNR